MPDKTPLEGSESDSLESVKKAAPKGPMETIHQESGETLHTLAEQSGDGIVILQDELIKTANPILSEMVGYSVAELIGTPFSRFVELDDISHEGLDNKKSASENHTASTFYAYLRHWSGTKVKCEFTAEESHYQGKAAKRLIIRNISGNKKPAEASWDRESAARALLDACPDSALLVDRQGIVIEMNAVTAERLGATVNEIKGRYLLDFFPKEVAESRRKKILQVISTGMPVRFEDEREGRHFYNSLYPVLDVRGEVKRLAILAFDITEIKKTEQALRERENDLKAKNKYMEELNTALGVLVKKADQDRANLEEKVLSNVKCLVQPYLDEVKKSGLTGRQQSFLNALESNLSKIISPFSQTLSSEYYGLSPAEIRVAKLVSEGKSSKEIADLLSLSPRTIESHRDSIRKKLKLKNKKINLRTYIENHINT